MEWVEVTGKTIEDAKEAALDELGVDESDAEFEVVTEPKAGLFGLMRSEARVRARVLPASARPRIDRRERRKSSSKRDRPPTARADTQSPTAALASAAANAAAAAAEGGTDSGAPRPRRSASRRGAPKVEGGPRPPRPVRSSDQAPGAGGSPSGSRRANRTSERPARPAEGGEQMDGQMDSAEAKAMAVEAAKEFLAGVASRFSDDIVVEHRELPEDVVEVAVTGGDLGLLIGPRGQTLSSLQELTRTVVQRKVPHARARIMVDVAGYREARRQALERFTSDVADQVKSSGEARELEPMSASDRKVVHDTANGIDGVTTTSEGEDPRRRVVISPTSGTGSSADD